jgi:PadR family transcriptional regulator PadR
MAEKILHGGFVRMHILHHACKESVFGVGMLEELGRHGYRLSAGTLYPILHELEKSEYLVSRSVLIAGKRRRVYTATRKGQIALKESKKKLWELFQELFEDELKSRRAGGSHSSKPARKRS